MTGYSNQLRVYSKENGVGRRGEGRSSHRRRIVGSKIAGDTAFLTTDLLLTLSLAICGLTASFPYLPHRTEIQTF